MGNYISVLSSIKNKMPFIKKHILKTCILVVLLPFLSSMMVDSYSEYKYLHEYLALFATVVSMIFAILIPYSIMALQQKSPYKSANNNGLWHRYIKDKTFFITASQIAIAVLISLLGQYFCPLNYMVIILHCMYLLILLLYVAWYIEEISNLISSGHKKMKGYYLKKLKNTPLTKDNLGKRAEIIDAIMLACITGDISNYKKESDILWASIELEYKRLATLENVVCYINDKEVREKFLADIEELLGMKLTIEDFIINPTRLKKAITARYPLEKDKVEKLLVEICQVIGNSSYLEYYDILRKSDLNSNDLEQHYNYVKQILYRTDIYGYQSISINQFIQKCFSEKFKSINNHDIDIKMNCLLSYLAHCIMYDNKIAATQAIKFILHLEKYTTDDPILHQYWAAHILNIISALAQTLSLEETMKAESTAEFVMAKLIEYANWKKVFHYGEDHSLYKISNELYNKGKGIDDYINLLAGYFGQNIANIFHFWQTESSYCICCYVLLNDSPIIDKIQALRHLPHKAQTTEFNKATKELAGNPILPEVI